MGIRIRETLIFAWLKGLKSMDRRHPDPAELGTEAIKKIVIFSNTAIGDTLLSTPAIRAVRETYPHAKITLVVHPAYANLFSTNPHLDGLIHYDGRWASFFKSVRALHAQSFDCALIFHSNEPQATPLAYLSGARWRFKLPNTSRFNFLLSNQTPILDWLNFEHGIDQRLAVAKLAGAIGTMSHKMELPILQKSHEIAVHFLTQHAILPSKPWVAFQVGASTASRRWPADRYIELGKQLLNKYPHLHIGILGSPQEKHLAENVMHGIQNERAHCFAGQLSLEDVPALLKTSLGLITPDTGIMHMAIAIQVPTIGLFAAANAHNSGATVDRSLHQIIQKKRTCDPCLGKRCPYPAPLCMDQITVEEVLEKVSWL